MKNKIAVVTALAGIDPAKAHPLYDIKFDTADYYIFTDQKNLAIPNGWNKRTLYPAFIDKKYQARRACRMVKQMSHMLLPDYDYYIWHDNINYVGEDPNKIVERLEENDMAFFEHPIQNGWINEMMGARRREHPGLVDRTITILKDQFQIPNDLPVWETTAFVRKNNKSANECCGIWNDLLNNLTSRDQVTLPAAIYLTQAKVGTLPGRAIAAAGNNEILPNLSLPLYFNGLTP